MSDRTTSQSICPCGPVIHPAVILNPPGRSEIAYRAGGYVAFRHALLRALAGETQLTQRSGDRIVQIWRPGAEGDLALQMMEWWAYLADVLTFYNERIANQDYLRTADLPESVNRLIELLGYRPRPSIGATGVLAALVTGARPVVLPKGFQIGSKPGPGKQPQVFELDADTTISAPDRVSALSAAPDLPLLSTDPAGNSCLWLKGTVTSIKTNDKLLLLNVGWPQAGSGELMDASGSAWLKAGKVIPQTGAGGKPVTQVIFSVVAGKLPSGAQTADYQLLKSGQSALPWSYTTSSTVLSGTSVELNDINRQIAAGHPILVEVEDPSAPKAALVSVESYYEQIWYANGDGPAPPASSGSTQVIAIAVPHTHLEFDQDSGLGAASPKNVTIRFGWAAAGELIAAPVADANLIDPANGLAAIAPGAFPVGSDYPVLLEDAAGNGASANGSVDSAGAPMALSGTILPASGSGLTAPLDVLFNLLSVSRGKTVAKEVLGGGDASVAGQDFTLKNSPVTYLQDPASRSGEKYSSTVAISVNGVRWTEVPTFYGQDADAQVFVTREDEQGKTHVMFGDGINGARLPSGAGNVVATYRQGAGAETPNAGTLTVVLQPRPGLKSIRNPIAVSGGADADPPDKIRRLAPRSVLTFGRAVSLDDYETIAAGTPGVARAKAGYTFDALTQRSGVAVWVGDDSGAVKAAIAAIASAADPNRLPLVRLATQVEVVLRLSFALDPRYDESIVSQALRTALADPDRGLLGVNVVGIGQAFFDSQIYAACLAVPGVQAVHDLEFSRGWRFYRAGRLIRLRERASEDGAAEVRPVHRHDPGEGGFFYLPNDDRHLTLQAEAMVAS